MVDAVNAHDVWRDGNEWLSSPFGRILSTERFSSSVRAALTASDEAADAEISIGLRVTVAVVSDRVDAESLIADERSAGRSVNLVNLLSISAIGDKEGPDL